MKNTENPPLMLSISGARGIIGQTMTPEVALRFAAAFGSELRQTTGVDHPLVVIGRDSRPTGAMLGAAAVSGLLGVGCQVIVLGVEMTPTIAIMVKHHNAQGGMVITASHNPIIWNGIKCLDADGVAPPPDQAQRIIDRFQNEQPDYVDVHHAQTLTRDESATDIHINRVINAIDTQPIQNTPFKVVLDSVNGAGCLAGRQLLEQLGVELIHLNGEPTGLFAHPPEPIKENLTDLAKAVRDHNADIGFAQDPDADRLAIVDEKGQYIGEEYSIVLAALHLLDGPPDRLSNRSRSIAVNLSTSRMIDDVAKQHNASVHRTMVGEANVAQAMKEHNCCIGGEGNGGVIWPEIGFVRDSLSGMALTLGLLAEKRMTLSQIITELPTYIIQKRKVDIKPGLAESTIEKLAKQYTNEQIDRRDGIRIDFQSESAWLHIRASNTEPILRIIAEAPTHEQAEKLINQSEQLINS